MNWKTFKNIVVNNIENLNFIDKNNCKRGSNDIRLIRFFFCGNFKRLVERYKAVGFYVIIEKNNIDTFFKKYELSIYIIEEKEQKAGELLFKTESNYLRECYNKAIDKLKDLCILKEIKPKSLYS